MVIHHVLYTFKLSSSLYTTNLYSMNQEIVTIAILFNNAAGKFEFISCLNTSYSKRHIPIDETIVHRGIHNLYYWLLVVIEP